jgi:hypothetical protein
MASVKIQLEFRLGADGWSEIYYHDGGTPKASQSTGQALVDERVKLLVALGTIHHVRISGTAPGSRSYRFPPIGGGGGRPAAKVRDVGAVTHTVGLYTANGVFRKLILHGFPDEASFYLPDGSAATAMGDLTRDFLQFLKTNNYQIRHLTVAANDDGNPEISAITAAGADVTFAGTFPGIAAKQKVRVSGCKGFGAAQFNGVWTVGSLVTGPPAGIKCNRAKGFNANFQYVASSGKLRSAQPAAYSYPIIDSWDPFVGQSVRKVGRPTDSPRGRRSLTR